jgi:putative PIN family toxin of toxin-antitoxin system
MGNALLLQDFWSSKAREKGILTRDREALSHVAVVLGELGRIVKPDMTLHVLKDDPDNRILECAVSSDADAIITGDKEILRLGSYAGVKIVSLAEYLS